MQDASRKPHAVPDERSTDPAAPEAATAAPGGARIPSGAHSCQFISRFVLDICAALLEEEARSKGGSIGVDDIRRITQTVWQTPPDLWRYYNLNAAQCLGAARGDLPEQYVPRNPLNRLIVHGFEHLFPERRRGVDPQAVIPRWATAPFLATLRSLLGETVFEECEKRAETILDGLHKELGLDFSWDIWFDHPQAAAILSRIQARTAVAFAVPNRRIAWFVDKMNHRRAESRHERGTASVAPKDTFTEHHLKLMLAGMMASTFRRASDPVVARAFADLPPRESAAVDAFVKWLRKHNLFHLFPVD